MKPAPQPTADVEDAEDRIYAGELRALGCNVPESIPDCAWAARSSMRIGPTEITGPVDEDGNVPTTTTITFVAPLRWVTATIGFSYDEGEGAP
jgi:hypothetical protein